MLIPQTAPMLLTRNLLYTGMTRAKKLLIMIGNDNLVHYMIQNADTRKRNTALAYRLWILMIETCLKLNNKIHIIWYNMNEKAKI